MSLKTQHSDSLVNPVRVLIIDDDAQYCEALSDFLRVNGCTVRSVHAPDTLGTVLEEFGPDLLLIDQCLGTATGTDVLRSLSATSALPTIVISGVSDPLDRIVNLEIGADDQIDKATSPRELLARIRAVLRRFQQASATPSPSRRALGQWSLEPERREVRRPDGSLCHLTSAEFDLLHILWSSRGQSIARAELMERVFRRPLTATDRAVDTAVRKLRAKIDASPNETCIKSVRGLGYAFTGFPDESRDAA